MKNYSIIVTEKESKNVILDITELSNTAKYLRNKYGAKYRFNRPECVVKVKRLIREGGVQTDLLTAIEEIENGK
jgi:hypothetical protein